MQRETPARPTPGPARIPEPPEAEEVDAARVACDGGGAAYGHPRVWLEFGEHGHVDCPYCDKRFIRKGAAGH
jgi:uncharacterized Zn-finger protein